LHHLQLQEVL